MTKASDNVFPRFLISEGGSTATPASGRVTVYAKADGLLYQKDDAGTETLLASGASGAVATDAIWDAAGDLAVGSGANTAAKLTLGSVGSVLGRINGAVAWNAGTSFPGSKATDDRFYRSDLDMEFFWDGTRWLSTQLFEFSTHYVGAGATASLISGLFAPHGTATSLWFVDIRWSYYVATTHTGTHYWTIQMFDTNVGLIGPLLTSDKATANASVTPTPTAIGSAFPAFSSDLIYFQLTKVSSPGAILFSAATRYRLIAT